MAGLDFSDRATGVTTYSNPKAPGVTVEVGGDQGGGGLDFSSRAAPVSTAKDAGKGFLSGVQEGVSSIADTVRQASPLGVVSNMLATAADLAQGRVNVTPSPFSAATQAAQAHGYQPQTTAGQYAKAVGVMAPNAFAPGMGGVVRRAAAVVLPGVASEAAGQAAQAVGGGPVTQAAARFAGGVAGGVTAGVRMNPLANVAPEDAAVNVFAQRAKPDVAAMRAKSDEMQAAGVQPTLIDLAGNRGRRLVRAVGVKSDQAGETLQTNALNVSATTKPAIMARTRTLGPNQGQTADELAATVSDARDNAATANYAGPYKAPVQITEDMKSALSDGPGRAALQRALRAAVSRRDDAQAGEIQSLLKAGSPVPQPPPRLSGLQSVKTPVSLNSQGPTTYPWPDSVSGATLDRIQIALGKQAERLRRNQGGDIASGLTGRQADINSTLDNTAGLGEARADFKAKSQALDVLGAGPKKAAGRLDVFSTAPADYGKWLAGLSPEAQNANKVAIRQEVLDTLGGQRASTLGSVDELASSEYAKANLRQALGAEADPYLAHLNARLEQVRNAGFVSPNGGSRTAVLENDLKGVLGTAKHALHAVKGGALGMVAGAAEWLVSRGVSEPQAQALAKAAVDPAQTERVLRQLEARFGRPAARQFLQHISRPALTAGALGALQAGSAAPPSPNQ